MKKVLSVLIVSLLLMNSLAFNSFAVSEQTNTNTERTTGLINDHYISLTKTGSTLIIYGYTSAATEVGKCGFKKLTLQYRTTSTGSWIELDEQTKIYTNGTYHEYYDSMSVNSSYQYRAVCEHYAYKNLFQTETIEETSNIA